MNDLDYYLMSNVPPRRTGLPFVVWISVRQAGFYDVHVWAARDSLDPEELTLLLEWMKLNLPVLKLHWDGEIDSVEAIDAVVSI